MEFDSVITLDPDDAADQAERYREIKAPTEEDKTILAGLLALAAGEPLIDLARVLQDGGCFDDGAPRLAVMWADKPWCHVRRTSGGHVSYSAVAQPRGGERTVFTFPGLLPLRHDLPYDLRTTWAYRLRSQVPIVPPEHRVRGWRTRCAVLWEVEEWAQAPMPPGDPALLRPLTDRLWTVEATWDLTDLERAVLGARQ